ncbi:MAG: hypothetical protein ACQERX_00800 [Bacillota bacterium]
MKKIIVFMCFLLALILVGCSSGSEYVELENCIDSMVDSKNNDACSQDEKFQLLEDYVNQTAGDYNYQITKNLIFKEESLDDSISFGISFMGTQITHSDDYLQFSLNYFETVYDDFYTINDDVKYNFTIDFIQFGEMTLHYISEGLFQNLEIDIDTNDNFDTLYNRYEDLLIELSDNQSFDNIDFSMNANDYALYISFKIELGYYEYSMSQFDDNSPNSFENIISSLRNTMGQTDLESFSSYQ